MAASGKHESETTPIPWLCAAVLVASLAFSIHARIESEAIRSQGAEVLAEASAYFVAHPYLEPGKVLAARLGEGEIARVRAAFEVKRVDRGWMRTPPAVARHQQDELNTQIATALAGVAELPARGVAVVPAKGFAASWLLHPGLLMNNWQLIGNGLLLLLLGVYLERSFGRLGFAALAITTTLAGAATWCVMARGQAEYGLVGSSPLLAGLLVAFAVRFAPHKGEGFYIVPLVLGTLWLALPPWAGFAWSFSEVALVASGPAPAATAVYPVFLAAAAAGLFGSGLAWLAGVDGERRVAGSSEVTRNPQYRRAMRAQAAGRPREALELLEAYLGNEPDAYEAAIALRDVAAEMGRDADVSAALLRVIRIEIKRGLSAAAIDHWLELSEMGIPERADPPLLIHMALLLREDDRKEDAVRALRSALERADDRAIHVIAARIARAARGLEPGIVEEAAWRALGSIELGLAERQALENLIGEVLEQARGAATFTYTPPRKRSLAPEPEGPNQLVLSAEGGLVREPSEASDEYLASIPIETDTRPVDIVVAVPLELGEQGLEIQTVEGAKKLVRFERIDAVALAAVHGLAAKPVLFVDLVLNWMSPANETLRVIRLRADRFDPRRLLPVHSSAVDALRGLVAHLLEYSGATPLPDLDAAAGNPFASFDDLETYQRVVLLVDGTTKY